MQSLVRLSVAATQRSHYAPMCQAQCGATSSQRYKLSRPRLTWSSGANLGTRGSIVVERGQRNPLAVGFARLLMALVRQISD